MKGPGCTGHVYTDVNHSRIRSGLMCSCLRITVSRRWLYSTSWLIGERVMSFACSKWLYSLPTDTPVKLHWCSSTPILSGAVACWIGVVISELLSYTAAKVNEATVNMPSVQAPNPQDIWPQRLSITSILSPLEAKSDVPSNRMKCRHAVGTAAQLIPGTESWQP